MTRFRSISPVLALAVAMLFAIGSPVRAENGCPYGYTPWRIPVTSQMDCVAMPESDDPDTGGPSSPSRPVYADRWGAVAIGSTAAGGGVGFTANQHSQSAAKRRAIQQCMATGGGDICRSKVLAYHNQCVAVSWGTHSYSVNSAPTLELAAADAHRDCGESTDNCRLFYSACSMSERIR